MKADNLVNLKLINLILYTPFIVFISSCASVQKATEVDDGEYFTKKDFRIDSLNIFFSKKDRLYLEDFSDHIIIHKIAARDSSFKLTSQISSLYPLKLNQNSFDVDLFTIPFKIRPSQADIPTQLNSTFNAAMYFGYRKDYLKISGTEKHPSLIKRKVTRNGIGAGVFIGMSLLSMNPTVTQGKINTEYDGLGLSYGISSIYAVQKFNAGFAVGFDFLTDKNRKIWIYQNKPWIGVLIGFNLN